MSDFPTHLPHADSRLTRLGWDRQVPTASTPLDPGLTLGRVIQVDRGSCLVATADSDHRARSTSEVAVGDWVGVARYDEHVVVEVVLPRRSHLSRRTTHGAVQILAANIDVVLIAAPADRLSLARVEREIAMAWDGGANPLVILTKSDLAEVGLADRLRQRLLGVEVIENSILTGTGEQRIRDELHPDRTAVLLGPSGAGKSSLVNLLVGTDELPVGDVRSGDHRGKHTTTRRQLIVVPGGGVVIDTPGLRSLALAGEDGLTAAFAEIEELAGQCRFHDCRHEQEPGCAVIAAVESGELDEHRVANYHKLRREAEYQARREDPVARMEAERVLKIRAKSARRLNRERGRDQDDRRR